ncbi:hypothetical protein [Polaromonas sp.]|uniref:hypothetical protein n=1 Tax=Polaromonas sp. TaxID=1869339 RepID=UPI0027319D10|nr:hypothetical protein [Polaromonas sp.]MDP1886625.1 hypothetical protein [Polaromonas sp.]
MREALLRLLLIGLLAVMWIFHLLVWGPAKSLALRMSKQLEALELALLIAGVNRRTRNERNPK